MNDSFYRDFEDRYRGPRSLIKSRLNAYAPFIEPLIALYRPADAPVLGRAAKRLVVSQHRYIHPPATAVDMGCGRGEWLELAGELGFDASGADLDEGMLAACHERGLNACKADAIETLRALPDASTALVSAFHLVEHLPFNDVRTLVREALRVLKPGGLLILETPNPENLLVSSTEFYMDPSHVRPMPSGLLGFAVEHAGFLRNKVVRLQESAGRPAAAKDGLIGVLYDVSFDYGIVAQKNASAEVLARFDEAFNANYGASLVALVQRYDQQAESRAAHIENQFAQAEARTAQAEAQMAAHIAQVAAQMAAHIAQVAAHADACTAQVAAHAAARTAQAEAQMAAHIAQVAAHADACTAQVAAHAAARAAQAEARMEARTAQIAAQLHLILNSRSWRITAPLRFAGHLLYRFRTAASEGRLISGGKRRIKALLCQLGQFAPHRAEPGSVTPQPVNVAPSHLPSAAQQADELSPRAARIYAMLKKAVAARKN